MSGWAESKHLVPEGVRPYFTYRDELHAEDGLVFNGNRLVMPLSLCKEMTDIAHQAHIEPEGCLHRMRETIF